MTDPSVPWSQFIPTTWPSGNLLLNFGLLLLAGALGGLLTHRARWLPTITGYMAVGFAVGPSGAGLLSASALDASKSLIGIALGLILFKLGGSLHPVHTLRNRALVMTSLSESLATFALVSVLMVLMGASVLVAALAGAIAVSSSPAVLIHVAHELHADGPTVQAGKNLVAANNILSFVLFSAVLPFALYGGEFDPLSALMVPAYQMLGAVLIGSVVGVGLAMLGRVIDLDHQSLQFAAVVGAVMLVLGLADALRVSPLFAALALGVACRWRQGRSKLVNVDFGGGGDIFFIILFVYAGANLHISDVIDYAPVVLAFVGVRTLAKLASVFVAGRLFGYPVRSVISAGMLLVPMAGLAIGLVQATHQLVPELGARVAAIVLASVAVFETIGPPVVAWALRIAGEARLPQPGPAKSLVPLDVN